MKAVADNLGRGLVRLQHGAHQPRCAVIQRPHAVEEVGGLPGSSLYGGERFLVGRAGMSKRHAMSARGEPAHEIEAAVELGGERDDSDVGRCALNLSEYLGGREIGTTPPLLSFPPLPAQEPPEDCAGSPVAAPRRTPG